MGQPVGGGGWVSCEKDCIKSTLKNKKGTLQYTVPALKLTFSLTPFHYIGEIREYYALQGPERPRTWSYNRPHLTANNPYYSPHVAQSPSLPFSSSLYSRMPMHSIHWANLRRPPPLLIRPRTHDPGISFTVEKLKNCLSLGH